MQYFIPAETQSISLEIEIIRTIKITSTTTYENQPANICISRGIPARLKAIETGYAYDPSGTCGHNCKICKSWNTKMAKDSVTTMKEIQQRKLTEHWQ